MLYVSVEECAGSKLVNSLLVIVSLLMIISNSFNAGIVIGSRHSFDQLMEKGGGEQMPPVPPAWLRP